MKDASDGPSDGSDALLDGILKELARFEGIQPIPPASGEKARPAPPAPFYQRIRGQTGWNPAFAEGLELARLEPGRRLEELSPSQLAGIPPVRKDSLVAVRSLHRRADFVPGENLYSRPVPGGEHYYAKVAGILVVEGNVIHVLPSDVDGRLSLRVAPDNLSAWLDMKPAHGKGQPPSLEDAKEILARMRIRYGVLETSLRDGLAACRQGRPQEGVPAAKGLAPRAGAAGGIEYFFDRDFQGPLNLTVGQEGKIDFRNVKWIPVVTKDQLLARVRPATPGQDGVDIFGNPVPADQPPQVYLVPGANVRAENDGTEFRSEINGCVQLNGTLLSVMSVFVVNADVDYRTGNIRFEGNVLVTGTVRKGFEVEATGDVVVLQNAEPCRIKAGRDVFVHGGVLGGGKGEYRIEAGRHISAGYAENAWLEAQGDIRIEDFALQSFLYSCGRILLEKKRGSLIGGESIAALGLEAKSLGTPAGVRTLVVAGVNFAAKRKLQQLERQRGELQEAALKVDRMLKTLLDRTGRGALPPSKVEALRIVAEKRKLMSKALHAVKTRIAELEAMREIEAPVAVKALEAAFPEVVLSIRGRTLKLGNVYYRSVFKLDEKADVLVRRTA